MPESDVGSYFGKYFLLKKLAAGGMGEVFLAKQQGPAGFEKILIIKKVLAHLTENKEFVELFLSEARLAARMNHRNIVQVFELGEQDGAYFIAMEYVQGKALRDVIDAAIKRKEKIPAELCRSVVEQICDGSSYAHNLADISGRGLNIVHRDLNPQNVLVSYTGDVKVIDFGIAKSEMSTVKTEAGMIKGKFVYMSPEQTLAKKLDKRSDIFPIGISLYEMLTGINPFHKNNIVLTLEAVQRYDPPPVSEYDPAYAPFDPIIAKALAKDRDRRYGDAAEMQDDLRRIVVPPAPERLGQFMSRLFRQQLEEEQKILKDTDSARVTSAVQPGKKTPAKPAPAAHQEPDNATMMLPPKPTTGKAQVAKPPPRPAPRAPAPPPSKKQGASDTLMDMQAPVIAQDAPGADEIPGATMMLKPGTPPPPPPSMKKKVTDTVPEGATADEGDNKTAFLGTAPPKPEARRKPPTAPPPSNGAGGTNIMTAEESQAAQKEALAKREANAGGPVAAPKRPPRPAAPAKKSGKGMWIALGVGALVVVGGAVAVAVLVLGDDPKPVRKPKALVPVEAAAVEAAAVEAVAVEAAAGDSGDKKAADAKPAGQKADVPLAPPADAAPAAEAKGKKGKDKALLSAPAPADAAPGSEASPPTLTAPVSAPAEKSPPKEKKGASIATAAAGAKMLGTLNINPGPNIPLTFNGQALGKAVGLQKLPVTAGNGTIEVGDATSQFKVTLEYTTANKEMTVKVKSEPWAIVSVDQVSKGKTPVADVKIGDALVTVELKKPGQESGMAVRLRYQGN